MNDNQLLQGLLERMDKLRPSFEEYNLCAEHVKFLKAGNARNGAASASDAGGKKSFRDYVWDAVNALEVGRADGVDKDMAEEYLRNVAKLTHAQMAKKNVGATLAQMAVDKDNGRLIRVGKGRFKVRK